MATNFCVHWSVDYFSYILFGLWCPVKENISTHLKNMFPSFTFMTRRIQQLLLHGFCINFIIFVEYKCHLMYVQPNWC